MTFAFATLAYSTFVASLLASEHSPSDSVARKLADEVAHALQGEKLDIDPAHARLASLAPEDRSSTHSFALYIPASVKRNATPVMLDAEESLFCGLIVFRSARPDGLRGEMGTIADLPDGSSMAGCEVAKVFLHRTASRRCSLEIIGLRKQPVFQAEAHPLGQRNMNLLEFENQVLAIQLDRSLVAFVPIARRIQGEERK